MGLIDDGLHWLEFALLGDGRATNLVYDVDFFEFQFRVEERLAPRAAWCYRSPLPALMARHDDGG